MSDAGDNHSVADEVFEDQLEDGDVEVGEGSVVGDDAEADEAEDEIVDDDEEGVEGDEEDAAPRKKAGKKAGPDKGPASLYRKPAKALVLRDQIKAQNAYKGFLEAFKEDVVELDVNTALGWISDCPSMRLADTTIDAMMQNLDMGEGLIETFSHAEPEQAQFVRYLVAAVQMKQALESALASIGQARSRQIEKTSHVVLVQTADSFIELLEQLEVAREDVSTHLVDICAPAKGLRRSREKVAAYNSCAAVNIKAAESLHDVLKDTIKASNIKF